MTKRTEMTQKIEMTKPVQSGEASGLCHFSRLSHFLFSGWSAS